MREDVTGDSPPLARRPSEQLMRELVAAELADQRGESASALAARVTLTDPMNAVPLRMDSLEFMAAAQAVNSLFRLHTLGTEDYLLRYRTLSEWLDVVLETIRQGADGLAFRSGGTTGDPRTLVQPWSHLQAEVAHLKELVPGTERIVVLVPCRHIYGCLWGPLLASHLGIPLLTGDEAEHVAHGKLASGDLVIAFPERWRYLVRSLERFPEGITGVTSTAPCPPALWRELTDAGLNRLLEIYGSSETGGIGWRSSPHDPFQLFAHWGHDRGDRLFRRDGSEAALPDHVDWEDDQRLRPVGRLDRAVQIGGVNVSPEAVRERMQACPDIAECAVRTRETANGIRLKAFIVPLGSGDTATRERIADWLHANLSAPERPAGLAFGEELPRNAMGKLCDWSPRG